MDAPLKKAQATVSNYLRRIMTTLQKDLLDDIFEVTRAIQRDFPEQTALLAETTEFMAENGFGEGHSTHDLRHFLGSLKKRLAALSGPANNPSIY